MCTDHHSEVLLLCWRTFKSLIRSVQNIARWFICKLFLRNSLCANLQLDRKQGEGQLSGDAAGHTCAALRPGAPVLLQSHSQISFHPLPQRNRGELPQTCKRDREKKKGLMFPQNVIMHNSHIQVCVSSHQLLRTISFGVIIPGFAFFPTKNKGVGFVGLGCSCDNRAHDTVTEDSGQPWK